VLRDDRRTMRKAVPILAVSLLLAVLALVAVGGSLSGPAHWSPDGLFYQARSLELRGTDHEASLRQTFQGPLGADLRRIDPTRSGDPDWVRFNAPFYERRVTVPAVAAALHGPAGDRAILDVSLAGYVAAVLALFWLLLLRFRLPIAAGVTLVTIFLPALTHHAELPLTDTWGLALETAAIAAGVLALERGRRWLVPWFLAVLVLSFTRDSTWIPLIAAGYVAIRLRSRISWAMLGTAVAAAVPVLLLYPMPMRELLAQMLNDARPAADPSWSFIVQNYPGAVVDLLRADAGFVRDGAWFSAAYLAGGLVLLFALTRGDSTPAATFLRAGAVAGALYVVAVPIFSAFRLDLVLVPMAAFGLGLAAERVAERLPGLGRVQAPAVAAGRSSA
jgi:hypothetical protein